MSAIQNTALLRIGNAPQPSWGVDQPSWGANQLWYRDAWQRRAGCGPTTCSLLFWYLSRTRVDCAPLCTHDGARRQGFLALMEEVWHYVTPGKMGVNSTDIFTEGAIRYARDKGVDLACRVLEIPPILRARPDQAALRDFLLHAFERDLPVAFLNLSNGALRNLDNWHWVTLVGLDPAIMTADMVDQSLAQKIDLGLWLRTTTLGGGLVVLEPR